MAAARNLLTLGIVEVLTILCWSHLKDWSKSENLKRMCDDILNIGGLIERTRMNQTCKLCKYTVYLCDIGSFVAASTRTN